MQLDGKLLRLEGEPRARAPRREVVLPRAQLVPHLPREVLEEAHNAGREAAERLEGEEAEVDAERASACGPVIA